MGQNRVNNYLGYAWTLIINIFTVFVVLQIFDSVHGNFETIIVCINVLIYLNLISFVSIWSCYKQQESFTLNDELKKIRKLLKEKTSEQMEEYGNKALENYKNKFKKQQMKEVINASFIFLIAIITLFHLLKAL